MTCPSYCLAHSRRRFVDVAKSFPAECRHVLEVLRDVYQIDAEAREQGLSPAERLALHQGKSAPTMETLETSMLVALQRNAEAAAASPGDWMPWSYAPTRDRLESPDPQPAPPSP